MPRMASFRISRSASIAADPALVHRLVNDFHEWQSWSPWEGLDPSLERTYSGADAGVGARYEWSGNRKAGAGSMEITASSPDRIDLLLTFLKPWKATNDVTFELTSSGGGTDVVWVMSGEQRGLMAVVGKVISVDKLVGKDFEKGLARLKEAAEA